ncbi:MAG: hypothetical protein ACD_4C00488G0002 [uncultured bacterium (gcode 4)]|uniref:Uncharacterized protein n=1 Tax=uncultured bacterium (gcode 4) TaxID=1234023 RepID=K2G775_9BACT|nr:MAG: hypothetical protein ACD_4C00488G0002 [uncultured bacterium (gcode 4)]
MDIKNGDKIIENLKEYLKTQNLKEHEIQKFSNSFIKVRNVCFNISKNLKINFYFK